MFESKNQDLFKYNEQKKKNTLFAITNNKQFVSLANMFFFQNS